MLIGLCGLPFNGKGTIANILKYRHKFNHMKFAAPLKDMLRCMLKHAGATDEVIERMIEVTSRRCLRLSLAIRLPAGRCKALALSGVGTVYRPRFGVTFGRVRRQ